MSLLLLGILNNQGEAAAGGASAYDLLETTVLAGTATSVVFDNLDAYSDYKHLQVRWVVMGDAANSALAGAIIYINGDTASNYAHHQLNSTGAAVTSGNSSNTVITLLDGIPGKTVPQVAEPGVSDFLDFSSTNKYKTVRSLYGAHNTTERDIMFHSGLWMNTNAITSIEYYSANTYRAGSRFSLYGIKG